MRELDSALDELIERFGTGEYKDEVVRARAAHAERTGKVYEDDELYEARTVAFLEWYVLERPLDATGAPPVEKAILESEDEDSKQAWRAWATSLHSLFLVEKIGEPVMRLRDLVGGARFEVDERRRLHGVAARDVIEARLVGWRGRVRFGRTFCFHPGATHASIVRHIRRVLGGGGTRADAVAHIASLRVRALRYKHMTPAKVYAL
jgi:hypothetical protein